MLNRLSMLALLVSLNAEAADLAAGIAAVERRDYAAALKQFRPLAAGGDVAAQVNLGNLYLKGLGVKQDYAEALRWFRLAGDQAEPMAWTKLGIMYFYGFGVEKDSAEAANWFRKAAERGDTGAQTVLASLYAQGDGVARDNLMAYYWYSLAAEKGNEDGVAGRDSLEEEISPGDRDEALRRLAEARKRQEEKDEQAWERAVSAVKPIEAESKPEASPPLDRPETGPRARKTGPAARSLHRKSERHQERKSRHK
jgi:hypothetical protein